MGVDGGINQSLEQSQRAGYLVQGSSLLLQINQGLEQSQRAGYLDLGSIPGELSFAGYTA